ncbi:hypothetical protein KMW28_26955 [Flammeovirga yaeyamensis]|uniref:Nitrogen regulatory protein P-II n=1 Tax=Flammeovirga yaeyamensis TaxID=367791 RepID=A0AAX1NAQ7_9BACT|nr:hypothetical protein [Flammeovirga yaeyamensis]MBB3700084.1 hypothetical protein [Flammeovirga yaeyamensis]NMF37482.1 hypothetical protein [Flammeovirga yaeyamensis]QWG04540.1 hypothetical protein KMW28_26955 [Flammeovirga yaeyamensis]
MKLVIIFSVDEGKQNDLYNLLSDIGASIFSESKVKGIYTGIDNNSSFFGENKLFTDSKMDVVALTDKQAEILIQSIDELNTSKVDFPLHAYCIDVERMTAK